MRTWHLLIKQNGIIMALFMVSLPSFWLLVMIVTPQLMKID